MHHHSTNTTSTIIDCHTHFFPEPLFKAIWKWFDEHAWEIRYKIQAEEVARHLHEAGVSRYVILNYAHKAGMSESLNAWTHAFAQNHPDAIPFGTIHPDDEDRDLLLDRCFIDYGFLGLKFHTHVSAIQPNDSRMFPIYEKLIEHDRVLMLHAGTGPSSCGYHKSTESVSGVRFVKPILKQFPKLKLVIPHLGAEETPELFHLMEEFPNLWMDTTMAVSGYFPFEIPWDSIEKFSDRILYGSDFPNIPYDITTEIQAIQNAPLSQKAKEQIFCRNAERLVLRCSL